MESGLAFDNDNPSAVLESAPLALDSSMATPVTSTSTSLELRSASLPSATDPLKSPSDSDVALPPLAPTSAPLMALTFTPSMTSTLAPPPVSTFVPQSASTFVPPLASTFAPPSVPSFVPPAAALSNLQQGPLPLDAVKGPSSSFITCRNWINANPGPGVGVSNPKSALVPLYPGIGKTSSMLPPMDFGHFSKKLPSGSSTQNLMALLGDLQQSQISVENDQKALEQNRLELNAINGKLKQLSQKKMRVQKQIGDGELAYAELASELSLVTIKEKVVSESLEKLQGDLVAGWERLIFLRTKISSVASRYLGECSNFAMMYNCTELGAQNRSNSVADELEEMRLSKHQLEYDLQKFLSMLTEVEKSEQENKQLQQQYREQEATESKKEIEAYNKLSEMERLLKQLEKRKESLDRSLMEETNKLQTKLETTKQSISYWERRVSENQRMVGHQKTSMPMSTNITNTINSATSPGFPSMTSGSIRLGNGQTVLTNNKVTRVSQYVRPTPHVSVSLPNKAKDVPVNSRKIVQTTLSFTNGKPMNPPFKPSKPKFTPPCVNVMPTVSSKSVPASSNQNNIEDDDPFNDSFSSSQYFKMPSPKKGFSTSVSSNYYNSSNQNINPANLSSSSGASRTFQFKKKPTQVTVTTPCRTSSVPLGTMPLPFSTFQSGRAVLQEKQQLQENTGFDYSRSDTSANY